MLYRAKSCRPEHLARSGNPTSRINAMRMRRRGHETTSQPVRVVFPTLCGYQKTRRFTSILFTIYSEYAKGVNKKTVVLSVIGNRMLVFNVVGCSDDERSERYTVATNHFFFGNDYDETRARLASRLLCADRGITIGREYLYSLPTRRQRF